MRTRARSVRLAEARLERKAGRQDSSMIVFQERSEAGFRELNQAIPAEDDQRR